MKVKKRNGSLVNFDPNKILKRIKAQSAGLNVNADEIAVQTMQGMYDGITTLELDELAASIAHSYTFSHPDYNKLAANLIVSRLHKETSNNFIDYINLNDKLNDKVKDIANQQHTINFIENIIDYSKDYNYDYFGICQLMKSYLLKDKNGKIAERPQQMYMRVALSLGKNLQEVKIFYEYLSNQYISAATPILFNAGTKKQNLISCNLTVLAGDDINNLFKTYKDIGVSSSQASGIGLSIDNLRSSKSIIKSTGGNAHGWLGIAKIINELMNVYNQGGKRPGSCALYGSVWHKDIFNFLELKLNTGDEKLRARDIFLAVNVPDNFMRAVENDDYYYLFCPKELKDNGIDFSKVHNEKFEQEYNKAVDLGIGEKVKAVDIYKAIIKSQIETGVPYVHFIDATNRNTNHSVYGKIKQSNLCAEIVQYSDEDTTAQCCLGSIPVQKFLNSNNTFDFDLFHKAVKVLTRMLNRVIDVNEWSTESAKKGGLEQRAIAIGIQGFANLLNKMMVSFDSPEAIQMNQLIAKGIYINSILESNMIASSENITYYKHEESPYAKGEFLVDIPKSTLIIKDGLIPLANSLFVAYMPTAGTAQIIGSSESFEPYHSNMFIREISDGYEFNIINKDLVYQLEKLGLWNDDIKEQILRNEGSVQNIEEIPSNIKEVFRTVWEIPQKVLIDLSANRQRYIDQSQSLNLFLSDPTGSKVGSMLMYSFKSGLKTGMYYLRSNTKNKANANLGLKRINKPIDKPKNTLFECEGCSA